MKQFLLFIFSLSFFLSQAWGAACCGGGFASPTIIVGDDKAQLSTSMSHTTVVVDSVDANGFWRKWDEHVQSQTFRVDGAHIFADLWQLGASVPLVRRSHLNQNYFGLADVLASVGYEYLSDWDYNPYKPKGIGFLQVTLPTGKSKFESETGGLDSRGNGLWIIGLGTLLTKTRGRWDGYTSIEVHRSFEKSVSNSQVTGTLKPGFGGSLGLGGGFNTSSWRFGSSVTWTYEDPIDVQGDTNLRGAVERYATAVAAVSYLASHEWAGTLSYADQTLFGNPINTSLGRTMALTIQRRWGR